MSDQKILPIAYPSQITAIALDRVWNNCKNKRNLDLDSVLRLVVSNVVGLETATSYLIILNFGWTPYSFIIFLV